MLRRISAIVATSRRFPPRLDNNTLSSRKRDEIEKTVSAFMIANGIPGISIRDVAREPTGLVLPHI